MTRALLCWLALAALTVAGCTSIPTTGQVEEVPVSAEPRGIDLAPQPPEPGVEPARLIEGFLQSMASPEGEYQVARDYLTRTAAETWEPEAAAVIDAAVVGEDENVRLDGTLLGALDPIGHFTADSGRFSLELGVVTEDGEWRISDPPDGLLLTRYIFERYYRSVTLYFMARAGTHVVPDPIHLQEAQVTPNAIVSAVLNGPSQSIRPAVSSAVPMGVTLGSQGATLDSDGIVTVNLVGLSPTLGDDARRRLGAQLMWSLTAIPRATGLLITNNGLPFTLPGSRVDGVLELASQQGYQVLSRATTADLFAVSDGQPGRVTSSGRFEAMGGVDTPTSDLAVSLDGELAALIHREAPAVDLGTPGGVMQQVEFAYDELRSPQFALGTLWLLADDDGRTVLLTVDRAGVVTEVKVDLPGGSEINHFAISPTGARAALLLERGGGSELGIATILPTEPASIESWTPMNLIDDSGAPVLDVTAVSWQAEASVAISGTAEGIRSVYAVGIDGAMVEELGPFAGDVDELSAMPRLGGGSVAVLTPSGVVWRYEARTRWTRLTEGVEAIAFAS